ncbi:MAG: hypothetical protein HOE48_16815 [Candidatus Latescibacteria bacterium]|nr:hypothetical protein [Candidatus Latescibacterota bacterium]
MSIIQAPFASTASAFVLLTDLRPDDPNWALAEQLAQTIAEQCTPILGFNPHIQLASLSADQQWMDDDLPHSLPVVTNACLANGANNVFVLPALLEFSIFQQQAFAECINQVRRNHTDKHIFYDAPDICHPLLFQAFIDRIGVHLQTQQIPPQQTGLLLVASGHGDPTSRAKSYQLMRLLWEHIGAQRAEVAFLRHEKTPLPEQLANCAQRPHNWLLVPQMIWNGEHTEYTRLILSDFQKQNAQAESWGACDPIGKSDLLAAYLQQRLVTLWNEHREKMTVREPSAKHQNISPSTIYGPDKSITLNNSETTVPQNATYGPAIMADVRDNETFGHLLHTIGIQSDPIFVKVTWHGYARGTYTDPVALDKLLSALPGRAILLEGHTVSRNQGQETFEWETESRENRTWIRDQEQDYLQRTGLQDVMDKHDAHYLNITEAYWDGQCANPEDIAAYLKTTGTEITHPELLEFIPQVLLDHAGCDFISFARFKGPTRLSISNCFGLLPGPLRAEWHGPNLTYFAKVCCEMAKIYGSIFNPFGLVEALNVAVRWNRKGLYRSRWGHYDLVPNPGMITLSRGLPGADMLASRLQGQNITRSAFFDVVRSSFQLTPELCTEPIADHLIQRFA